MLTLRKSIKIPTKSDGGKGVVNNKLISVGVKTHKHVYTYAVIDMNYGELNTTFYYRLI